MNSETGTNTPNEQFAQTSGDQAHRAQCSPTSRRGNSCLNYDPPAASLGFGSASPFILRRLLLPSLIVAAERSHCCRRCCCSYAVLPSGLLFPRGFPVAARPRTETLMKSVSNATVEFFFRTEEDDRCGSQAREQCGIFDTDWGTGRPGENGSFPGAIHDQLALRTFSDAGCLPHKLLRRPLIQLSGRWSTSVAAVDKAQITFNVAALPGLSPAGDERIATSCVHSWKRF